MLGIWRYISTRPLKRGVLSLAVLLVGSGDNAGGAEETTGQPNISHVDREPPLRGGIAFETLENSEAFVDDVTVVSNPRRTRGLHWVRTGGPLGGLGYDVRMQPNNPDIIYAGGFQTGIYQSTDGGKKWKHSFKGLDNLDIHAIAVTPGNSDLIYAGTMGNGVYASSDGGKLWQYVGIKNGYVSEIKIIEE